MMSDRQTVIEDHVLAFLALVRQMREQQRLYFDTRSPAVLQNSKKLERDVDRAVVQLRQAITYGDQQDLF